MTGAKYEYLGSNVHLYQEAYLKKGPGLGVQENYMPPMPTAPQTLKIHLAHRGTHTNKTTEEHTEADQLTNHQRDHFKGHNSHPGADKLLVLKYTRGTLSRVRPCLTADTMFITVM